MSHLVLGFDQRLRLAARLTRNSEWPMKDYNTETTEGKKTKEKQQIWFSGTPCGSSGCDLVEAESGHLFS